jgi:hypothetical protein
MGTKNYFSKRLYIERPGPYPSPTIGEFINALKLDEKLNQINGIKRLIAFLSDNGKTAAFLPRSSLSPSPADVDFIIKSHELY